MVHGTEQLLRSTGINREPLANQVEAACRAALTQISRTSS
jgi:hypothetical protein